MPVQYTTPPATSLQALQEAADRMSKHTLHTRLAARLQQTHDHPLDHAPQAIYTVDLKALAAGQGLEEAALVGYEYLAGQDGDDTYAIEVYYHPRRQQHQLGSFRRRPFAAGMPELLGDAEFQRRFADATYTPSLLLINALQLRALWLRAEDSAPQAVIVLPPAPAYLKPWPEGYTPEQLHEAVREAAARTLTNNLLLSV